MIVAGHASSLAKASSVLSSDMLSEVGVKADICVVHGRFLAWWQNRDMCSSEQK